MKYKPTKLHEELHIRKIITIHYYEYMSDFTFDGESHDFWELLCVDKGVVDITAGREKLALGRGDIIFHKPNEFHALAANGIIPPNLVVISFECSDPCMHFFENRVLSVGDSERTLLAQIITEARHNFSNRLDNPYTEQMIRKEAPPFGCEQMMKLHLEQLLIQLYRSYAVHRQTKESPHNTGDSDHIYEDILAYFDSRIRSQLTLEQICRDNLIGNSQLKKLFREKNNSGVMQCFIHLKIGEAKRLIRSRQMNFTQIADYLGYGSVHYFSRQFKKETGMTPSEYTASIKQLAERL